MELVIHILLPLMRYPESVLVARVLRAKASEPEAGSLRQKDPTVSVANFGRYFFFIVWLPHFKIAVFTKVLWTSHKTLTLGSTRASSSIPTIAAVKFMPAPPYSSGISMPIRPCSKRDSMTVGSMVSASSMDRTLGAMVARANLETVSAIRVSVSEKWVMGVGRRVAWSMRSARWCGVVIVKGRDLGYCKLVAMMVTGSDLFRTDLCIVLEGRVLDAVLHGAHARERGRILRAIDAMVRFV